MQDAHSPCVRRRAGGAGEHALGHTGARTFILVVLCHRYICNHAGDAHIKLGGSVAQQGKKYDRHRRVLLRVQRLRRYSSSF